MDTDQVSNFALYDSRNSKMAHTIAPFYEGNNFLMTK